MPLFSDLLLLSFPNPTAQRKSQKPQITSEYIHMTSAAGASPAFSSDVQRAPVSLKMIFKLRAGTSAPHYHPEKLCRSHPWKC